MIVPFGQDQTEQQIAKASAELAACNPVLARYGLALSPADIQALVVGRMESLATSERIEFGGGVTQQLVLGFAGSSYVAQTSFAETILELQDLFYEFKNESLEQIPDDELVAKMRALFDDFADGDVGRLEEALFEGLARTVRNEIARPPRRGFHDYTEADRVEKGYDSEELDPSDFNTTDPDVLADPEADNATANAYTLAASRYDLGKWVDEDYLPGWISSSWLDE